MRTRSKGFSFVEILIGTIILAGALIPIYSSMVAGSKTAVSSRLAYLTSQIAREIMEEAQQVPPLKLQDWVRSVNGGGTDFRRVSGKLFRTTAESLDNPSGGQSADSRLSGPPQTPDYPADYNRFMVKATLEDTGVPNLKKLVLEVKWEENAGRNEKPRPALSKFETLIGSHSVDPTIPADS